MSTNVSSIGLFVIIVPHLGLKIERRRVIRTACARSVSVSVRSGVCVCVCVHMCDTGVDFNCIHNFVVEV